MQAAGMLAFEDLPYLHAGIPERHCGLGFRKVKATVVAARGTCHLETSDLAETCCWTCGTEGKLS